MRIRTIGTGRILEPYSSASTLVDGTILVDCGFGVVKNLIKFQVDLSKIRTVLITHLHADHFFELPALFLRLRYLEEVPRVRVLVPEGGREAIFVTMKYLLNPGDDIKGFLDAKFEIIEYKDGEVFEFDEHKIAPILVDHGNMKPAYGFIIADGKNFVGFSGDSTECAGVNWIVEKTDIAVLDTSTMDVSNIAHMGLDAVSGFARKYPEKKIVMTHTGVGVKRKARELEISNLIIPEDGEEIEV